MASVEAERGDPERALEKLGRALTLTRDFGDRLGEAEVLCKIARAERDRGDLPRARTAIEAALEIAESLRAGLLGERLRTAYFASAQEQYSFSIDLFMQLHRQDPSRGFDSLGFLAVERARARSLLELLGEAGAGLREAVAPALRDRERSLRWAISAKRFRLAGLSGEGSAEAAAFVNEIAELEAEYDGIEAQVRVASPQYAALTQPKPLTAAEIQSQVLDADTLLLEYALGEERSFLWAVTKEGISSFELPKRSEIEAVARRIYERLIGRPSGGSDEVVSLRRDLTRLSEMVLGPVAALLGKRRLVVVGDGALRFMPFGVLPGPRPGANRKGPVVALTLEHEIVNLPSASSLAALRRQIAGREPAPKTLAVLADPVFEKGDERVRRARAVENRTGDAAKGALAREESTVRESNLTRSARDVGLSGEGLAFSRLPFTRREAKAILQLVPSYERRQALDFAANRDAVFDKELTRFRYVHFATHGFLDTIRPELSGIVLSLVDRQGREREGFLSALDVMDLRLSADLVVLSACRTALGKEIRGEGLVGLTRAFMYAGAPRVVASLWRVDDAATAELMRRFYQGMLGPKKLRPAAALREAQLAVRQQKRWEHPYYWAGFVLQGEWR
jgi:CHAT domain-containing protein